LWFRTRNLLKLRDLKDDAEHIAFNHFGISATIGFAVSHHFSHTGTQLIGPVYFTKKSADDWIFWKRGECGWMQYAEPVGFIPD
jgi:hypothetical protein